MINIPAIPVLIIYYLLIARTLGFLLIGLAFAKALSEYKPEILWLKRFVKRVSVFKIKTHAKKLLLIFTGILWFSVLIPLIQTVCYLFPVCLPMLNVSIIPASIAIGTSIFLTGSILYLIYYTEEAPPDIDNKAVKDIQKSLKTIGEQTKRAEVRSEEIDLNTNKEQGKIMRGVTQTKESNKRKE